MATGPEKQASPITLRQKVAQQVPTRSRLIVVIVALAVAGSFAAQPVAAIIGAGSVLLAWDYGRRR